MFVLSQDKKYFQHQNIINSDCKIRKNFNRKNFKNNCKFGDCGDCCDCRDCRDCVEYRNWYYDIWKKEGHLRFDFDARYEFTNNKKIIDLFNEDFINKKCVVHSWKGGIYAYVISKLNYNKYNYWEKIICDEMPFPFEKCIDFCGSSTVQIITNLIRYCENTSFVKIH